MTRREDPLNLFGGFLGDESWRPAVDVYETDEAVVVQVEISGVRREDLKIHVEGERVIIRGRRSPARDADIQRLHQVEIASGRFERILRIGIPFESNRVSASIEDGFLKVVLPRKGPSKIPVKG